VTPITFTTLDRGTDATEHAATGHPAGGGPGTTADPTAALGRSQAQALQRRAGAWFLLMYSPYWRRLIAIFAGQCDHGIVLQASDPDELWQLMNRVAPAGWQTNAIPAVSAQTRRSVPGIGRSDSGGERR
jgi:hypothetical protein